MKDELFADLLASAEEMVRIEKGEQTPKVHHVHTFSEVDVKAIREATGLKQQDFAAAVGVSYELVKSWETKRRHPTGASREAAFIASGQSIDYQLVEGYLKRYSSQGK